MEFSVFTKSLKDLPTGRPLMINTINQYSYCMAQHDPAFRRSLLNSDVLLPDGIAIVAAMKVLTGQNINKIAGADLHHHYLAELNQTGGKCFYLGSSESTLEKIKTNLALEYPNVKVETYSPPFKKEFSLEDDNKMVQAINNFHPDVLFVGMTAPKQEKWVNKNKHKIHSRVICTIGAVFDFYAGTVERPASIYRNNGLEWLGRLINEPNRMWRRYLIFGPIFLATIMKRKTQSAVLSSKWVSLLPGVVVPTNN